MLRVARLLVHVHVCVTVVECGWKSGRRCGYRSIILLCAPRRLKPSSKGGLGEGTRALSVRDGTGRDAPTHLLS